MKIPSVLTVTTCQENQFCIYVFAISIFQCKELANSVHLSVVVAPLIGDGVCSSVWMKTARCSEPRNVSDVNNAWRSITYASVLDSHAQKSLCKFESISLCFAIQCKNGCLHQSCFLITYF